MKPCPRCKKTPSIPYTTLSVCTWCIDDIIAGSTDRLKGYGYDLTRLVDRKAAG